MSSPVPKLFSADVQGIEAELVEVEADFNAGLHAFHLVGLADKAVSEAKERVNSALKNCGIKPPTRENRRITINLAPANIKKVGSHFDLPIALAYLLASDQIKRFSTSSSLFVGELSLDGSLRPVPGCFSLTLLAKQLGFSHVFVPSLNAKEAALVHGIHVIAVSHLKDLIHHLEGTSSFTPEPPSTIEPSYPPSSTLISDVKGHDAAKRALLVAAAGGHNVLLYGPPGTGKTMLAHALHSILPPPTREECTEVTQIYSAAGLLLSSFISHRPFRSPHHGSSFVSVVGGGSYPKPGEVSLAHRGILFLDETPEFHRDVLEALRQPLETGIVHVSRIRKALTFPARFMLVLAMNPCPCGYFDDPQRECRCTAHEILRYNKKISGPLLDRIDIHLSIPRVPLSELRSSSHEQLPTLETEDEMCRATVHQARMLQISRFRSMDMPYFCNADMSSKHVQRIAELDLSAEALLKTMIEKTFLSPRGYYRILKVARTIADIEASPIVTSQHLSEAFQYRMRRE